MVERQVVPVEQPALPAPLKQTIPNLKMALFTLPRVYINHVFLNVNLLEPSIRISQLEVKTSHEPTFSPSKHGELPTPKEYRCNFLRQIS